MLHAVCDMAVRHQTLDLDVGQYNFLMDEVDGKVSTSTLCFSGSKGHVALLETASLRRGDRLCAQARTWPSRGLDTRGSNRCEMGQPRTALDEHWSRRHGAPRRAPLPAAPSVPMSAFVTSVCSFVSSFSRSFCFSRRWASRRNARSKNSLSLSFGLLQLRVSRVHHSECPWRERPVTRTASGEAILLKVFLCDAHPLRDGLRSSFSLLLHTLVAHPLAQLDW